jgi:hypothetical protein
MAALAYTHRDDIRLFIRCQEEAHARRFGCVEIRAMALELLEHREELLDGLQLRAALYDQSWCPAAELFRDEPEAERFHYHPPCGET